MKSVSQVHVCVDDGVPGFYLARVTAVTVETRNPGSPEIPALRNGTIAQNNRKWEVNILQIELACGASTENAQSTRINLTLGIGINRHHLRSDARTSRCWPTRWHFWDRCWGLGYLRSDPTDRSITRATDVFHIEVLEN